MIIVGAVLAVALSDRHLARRKRHRLAQTRK
jgi:hypothetical protein